MICPVRSTEPSSTTMNSKSRRAFRARDASASATYVSTSRTGTTTDNLIKVPFQDHTHPRGGAGVWTEERRSGATE
ncbi:hypothetical protein GCM10010140_44680 [Streptosporangium pseudovulgare]|uniref:Uncharacterized protein n=1 Tax=Streptosporangium pseudovulgare TaxID=35765 RepID=A0ABQ2R1U9_9ACTN|nr:hypothetical protein GCM10010140_44680 [Streptosporangium pseudovulgare]